MIKLGLIGREISHSKSPQLYKELLAIKHQYDLLDYASESSLPQLRFLDSYYGLNITAPYKKSFLSQLKSFPIKWGAVNCLKQSEGIWVGENTDAQALIDLIPQNKEDLKISNFVILGDGAMADITKIILSDFKFDWTQHSRRLGDDFSQFSFLEPYNPKAKICLINTCARDVVVKGSLSPEWIFWDYNYQHKTHGQIISKTGTRYIDGESLLYTQAKYAVKFWQLD